MSNDMQSMLRSLLQTKQQAQQLKDFYAAQSMMDPDESSVPRLSITNYLSYVQSSGLIGVLFVFQVINHVWGILLTCFCIYYFFVKYFGNAKVRSYSDARTKEDDLPSYQSSFGSPLMRGNRQEDA